MQIYKTMSVLRVLTNFVEDFRVDESWRFTPFKGLYKARVDFVRAILNAREKITEGKNVMVAPSSLANLVLTTIPQLERVLKRENVNLDQIEDDRVRKIIEGFQKLPKQSSIASFGLAVRIYKYLRELGFDLDSLDRAGEQKDDLSIGLGGDVDCRRTGNKTKKDDDIERILRKLVSGDEADAETELEEFEKKYTRNFESEQKRRLKYVEHLFEKKKRKQTEAPTVAGNSRSGSGYKVKILWNIVNQARRKFRVTLTHSRIKRYGIIGQRLDIKRYALSYGKQEGFKRVFVKRSTKPQRSDIILMVDRSGSMDMRADLKNEVPKIVLAYTAAIAVSMAMYDRGGRVVLYIFPGAYLSDRKYTTKLFDTREVRSREEWVNRLLSVWAGGGTPLDDTLERFLFEFKHLNLNNPVLIVITDGIVSHPAKTVELLKRVIDLGVSVYCLHIGSEQEYNSCKELFGSLALITRVEATNLVNALMELSSQIMLRKR